MIRWLWYLIAGKPGPRCQCGHLKCYHAGNYCAGGMCSCVSYEEYQTPYYTNQFGKIARRDDR